MTWGTPTCIGHLIRDKKNIVLICTCGHEMEREPRKLRKALSPLGGYREDLADLNDSIMCPICGRSEFSYEIVARS